MKTEYIITNLSIPSPSAHQHFLHRFGSKTRNDSQYKSIHAFSDSHPLTRAACNENTGNFLSNSYFIIICNRNILTSFLNKKIEKQPTW